jgi:hypothetical protein
LPCTACTAFCSSSEAGSRVPQCNEQHKACPHWVLDCDAAVMASTSQPAGGVASDSSAGSRVSVSHPTKPADSFTRFIVL